MLPLDLLEWLPQSLYYVEYVQPSSQVHDCWVSDTYVLSPLPAPHHIWLCCYVCCLNHFVPLDVGIYLKEKMFFWTLYFLTHQQQIMGQLELFSFQLPKSFFLILNLIVEHIVSLVTRNICVMVGFDSVEAVYLIPIDHLCHYLLMIGSLD